MASFRCLISLLVVVAVVVAVAPRTASAVSCNQVYNALMPCLNYVTSGGALSTACCSGIRSVAGAAQTTPDRQTICGCLKTVASGTNGGYLTRASGLPSACRVNIPYKIDPNVDCNKIQ